MSGRTAFALSGVVMAFACINAPVLLPFPLLVLVCFTGWRLPAGWRPPVRLFVATAGSTLLLETGAWLDNFLRNTPAPALFHPQLIPDLVIGVGVYVAWWLTWWLALRRFAFSTAEVFVTTGLYGILLEQQGKILLAGLKTFPTGLVLWAFVALAYGSTMALAVQLGGAGFPGTRRHWVKYPLTWAGLFLMTYATSILWGFLLAAVGFAPPKRFPMREHPFW